MMLLHLLAIPLVFLLGYWLGKSRPPKPAKTETVVQTMPSGERNGYDRPYIPGDPGYMRGIDG